MSSCINRFASFGLFWLAALAALSPAQAANNHPLVLVYGFLGFDPEQFKSSGFKYWGGFDDIVGHLRSHHGTHQVWAASVGPVSSSWDRAAELYFQIKGGCVDYGRAHSAKSAHLGKQRQPEGKCWAADPNNNPNNYPLALYPAWDAQHPIHLLGHSQGGQTIRALIELLEHGSPHGNEGGAALYRGGKVGWVMSATTLSAPHNGTTLHDAMSGFTDQLTKMSSDIAELAQSGTSPQHDYMLDQFGIRRNLAESAAGYQKRVLAAPFWNQNNFDSAQWEMAPDGAREFNGWARTSPSVYYFSAANVATEAGSVCCNYTDRKYAPYQHPQFQYPRDDMAPLTKPYAGEWIIPSKWKRGLGSYTQFQPGRVPVDGRWFPNDGVVNTFSMRSPAGHPVRDYDGVAVRGTWNFLQTYRTYDHFDMLGWPRSGPKVYPIYDTIAGIIYSL